MSDVKVGSSNTKTGAFIETTDEEEARSADEEDGDESGEEEAAVFDLAEAFMLFEPAPDEVDADDKSEHEAVRMDEGGERDC